MSKKLALSLGILCGIATACATRVSSSASEKVPSDSSSFCEMSVSDIDSLGVNASDSEYLELIEKN